MSPLALFTQEAYLRSSAADDSQVFVGPDLAYIATPSSKERWLNGCARCNLPVVQFGELRRLIADFDRRGINFNWHLWSDADPRLGRLLRDESKLEFIGADAYLTKAARGLMSTMAPDGFRIEPLSAGSIGPFVDAKMSGWHNPPDGRDELVRAARRSLANPQSATWLAWGGEVVVGAVSSYSQSELAYLRADFVRPEFRGRGIYRQLIRHRERELAKRGIQTFTVFADVTTSAPIFEKTGYGRHAVIEVYARRRSPWVSL